MTVTLKGRAAIVTGSTSGIGLGIARSLAKAGSNLTINGFGDAAAIEEVRSGLEKEFGIRAIYSGADISDADAVKGMVDATVEAFGSADILVNNAGIQHTAPVDQFPLDKWNAILAINLSGAFYGIRAVLPHMKAKGWGRVVNIASAHGLVASTEKAAYVAAKHGIVGLTKVVALETAESNITCNAICPGWVLTPLVQKQIDAIAERDGITVPEAQDKLLSEKQPSKRFASPEQLGELTVFLCSDAAQEIRGVALPMDGGWTSR